MRHAQLTCGCNIIDILRSNSIYIMSDDVNLINIEIQLHIGYAYLYLIIRTVQYFLIVFKWICTLFDQHMTQNVTLLTQLQVFSIFCRWLEEGWYHLVLLLEIRLSLTENMVLKIFYYSCFKERSLLNFSRNKCKINFSILDVNFTLFQIYKGINTKNYVYFLVLYFVLVTVGAAVN